MQNSDPGGAISGQSILRAFRDVRPGDSMGAAPDENSEFTSLTRPTEGCELDVPRLATLRGRARGRARANLRSLQKLDAHLALNLLSGEAVECAGRDSFIHDSEARATTDGLIHS